MTHVATTLHLLLVYSSGGGAEPVPTWAASPPVPCRGHAVLFYVGGRASIFTCRVLQQAFSSVQQRSSFHHIFGCATSSLNSVCCHASYGRRALSNVCQTPECFTCLTKQVTIHCPAL